MSPLALLSLKLPTLLFAADYGADCTLTSHSFFFLPSWWEYVPTKIDLATNQCAVAFKFPQDTWAVALAILDMLLRVGGFVAVISIIIAGIQYLTATGPDKGTAARKRIVNSLIGLAIVLVASVTVKFIGSSIGG